MLEHHPPGWPVTAPAIPIAAGGHHPGRGGGATCLGPGGARCLRSCRHPGCPAGVCDGYNGLEPLDPSFAPQAVVINRALSAGSPLSRVSPFLCRRLLLLLLWLHNSNSRLSLPPSVAAAVCRCRRLLLLRFRGAEHPMRAQRTHTRDTHSGTGDTAAAAELVGVAMRRRPVAVGQNDYGAPPHRPTRTQWVAAYTSFLQNITATCERPCTGPAKALHPATLAKDLQRPRTLNGRAHRELFEHLSLDTCLCEDREHYLCGSA